MDFNLISFFQRKFKDMGFDSNGYNALEFITFDNHYMRGLVTLDKESKLFKIKWTCKPGYVILDVPIARGSSSVEYKKPQDLLNFIQRRLACKKRD